MPRDPFPRYIWCLIGQDPAQAATVFVSSPQLSLQHGSTSCSYLQYVSWPPLCRPVSFMSPIGTIVWAHDDVKTLLGNIADIVVRGHPDPRRCRRR